MLELNGGGSSNIAKKFANKFILNDSVCGYIKKRIPGFDHNAFTELIPFIIEANAINYYNKPVMCLIGERVGSSAEWFTLMMKQGLNVTLLGDRTYGATGKSEAI